MKSIFLPAIFAASFALPAFACESVHVIDPYARVTTAMSQSGAAFMQLVNHGAEDRRLIGVRSDVAERVELHTHIEDANGVMRMTEVEEGFLIPANGTHDLARGGDHIMFLGLTRALAHGDEITVTLVFEGGEDKEIIIPVDLERMPEHNSGAGHSQGQSHGKSHN